VIPFERMLSHCADRYGDRTAIVGTDRAISYRELEETAIAGAIALRDRGVGPGQVVALLAPNSISFYAGYFAILMSGAVVAPLSPDATAVELAAMIKATAPAAAIVLRAHRNRDYQAEIGASLPVHVLWISTVDGPDWARRRDRDVIVDRPPHSPGLLAFTSGSTGRPKAARHRSDTLIRSASCALHRVLDGKAVTSVTTFPLHNMGGINSTLPVLLGGGQVVIMDRFHVPTLIDLVERHRVDFILAIPAMVELLFLKGGVHGRDLSSLSRVLLSGAPVSNALCRRIADELGAQPYVAYGLTEVPGVWLVTGSDTPIDEIGPFVGWPVEGYELRIAGDNGEPLAVEEVGEVLVRTDFRLLEYVGEPELTAAVIDPDGWVRTGDLGSLRPDGGLMIRGRKKEMYIRGGYNVYPREVEETLTRHHGISQAAVLGMPDPVLGEKGIAWLVPQAGTHLSEVEVREFAGQRLSQFKVPDYIRIVETMPMTPVGKIDKVALRARAIAELTQGLKGES
jgi:acyl-CoA synthetase (AMP-forming)/AMP-acid ligase II